MRLVPGIGKSAIDFPFSASHPLSRGVRARYDSHMSHAPRPLSALQRVIAVVRRIIGVPDYETYLAHMLRHHPECTPLDPRTFERQRMADRYSRPGSRCC